MKHVNLLGTTTCLLSHVASQEWIIDSGATHHITSAKEIFSRNHDVVKSNSDKVNLPTGAKADVSHIGEAVVFKDEVVQDVLLVPDFKCNLLSVSKITKQLSCFVSFYPDLCVFRDLHSGKVKGIGKEKGGLYCFKYEAGMKTVPMI